MAYDEKAGEEVAPKGVGSPRVLLVDDNPDDRALVERELRKDFPLAQTFQVSTPGQLEAAIAQPGIDLVITDFHLRWSTGLEVLKRIRARDPKLPVIMFTGTGTEEVAVEAMRLGLADYVTKSPKHMPRLRRSVKAALSAVTHARAREQAETLLRTRALSSYYDEVALRGLQLAASDVGRGVLTQDQVVQMREELHRLVEELDGHDDSNPDPTGARADTGVAGVERPERETASKPAPERSAPAPDELAPAWRGTSAVLCVAGRGPLDEAASEMLAQLLRKHGLGAAVASHEAVSRTGIATLDAAGVAMVCVSALELSGSPTHLRFLMRRLRARLPDARILIGLWPADGTALADPAARESLGADHYAASLRDAVGQCVAAAHEGSPAADVRSAAE